MEYQNFLEQFAPKALPACVECGEDFTPDDSEVCQINCGECQDYLDCDCQNEDEPCDDCVAHEIKHHMRDDPKLTACCYAERIENSDRCRLCGEHA